MEICLRWNWPSTYETVHKNNWLGLSSFYLSSRVIDMIYLLSFFSLFSGDRDHLSLFSKVNIHCSLTSM